jgi:hypothetical protein
MLLIPLLRAFRVIFLALPLAVGLIGETQTIKVPLLYDVLSTEERPLEWARVELSDPRLEVYSARLVAFARMRGLS